MRVLMLPHLRHFRSEESGIKRVVEAYFQHLPKYGIELITEGQSYDVKVVHAGMATDGDVAACHGLYWTADYPAIQWEWRVNADVIESLRQAKEITVPSQWVAESIRRDMHRDPHVIGHGIDWDFWQHDIPDNGYVLWNKNRASDVCDPRPVTTLAKAHPKTHFVSTFATKDKPGNIDEIGLVEHSSMMELIQGSSVYLATVKETFGIGILEAMASGVPVLGYGHGGILDLVEHGVNGYLAQPYNPEDLIAGLAYCIRNRGVLGENGREMARQHTWEKVCEQVAGVYRLASEKQKPTVAIIIPSFNYADKVGRAIESAINQEGDWVTEIIVVDDGSTDNTKHIVESIRDGRVRYLWKENGGVATARNHGIASATGAKYICCVDADDAIEASFIGACVGALEADRSIGIAYTGLRYILPTGEEGTSPWPGTWSFDAQLERKNQIPTCCVFRRDMWEALGGYRQRYAPGGAGSEDAEFWTRSGAYGWGAEKVTEAPLFIYSWKSGRVSGAENYQEVDWLAWHPWAEDKQHPFASYAKPKRFSHAVRQYDEPVVSVIIPVGPGHETSIISALDSLEAQTFRKWEVIVVWDTKNQYHLPLLDAYPFVRWEQTEGSQGPGAARNIGAKLARGPFLLFLDADDWLVPEAIERMIQEWEQSPACVYSDYVGKAFGVDTSQLSPKIEVLHHEKATDEYVLGYQASNYDWQRAQRQPEGPNPWIWCNVTTLTPKTWHDEIGGFDESMPSWEDVDYWYRMARAGKPFTRIQEQLLVYQFHSGSRRDQGAEKHQELIAYMTEKYKEVETVPCSGCGKTRRTAPATQRVTQVPMILDDKDFVKCVYMTPKRNQHPTIGATGFTKRINGLHMIQSPADRKLHIHYGFRCQGDKFLVHRADMEIAPHLFVSAEQKGPEEVVKPTPAPMPIGAEAKEDNGKVDLQKIPGVTPSIASQLIEDGVTDVSSFLSLGVSGLQEYKGVGAVKAQQIMDTVSAWNT